MNSQTRNSFLYATIVAMGGFIFGLDAALISGTTDYLKAEFSLSSIELGSVVAAPALGVLFALPFAGLACDFFGRKRTLLIVAALYLVSAVSSAFAPSASALWWARFLGGLAFSSISLASMYIGEIAPSNWRGKLVSMTQINIVVGLFGAYFVNYLIDHWAGSGADWVQSLGIDQHTWRWMLGSEIPPALVWFSLLLIIPETPYWLVFRDRPDDAKEVLRKVLPEDEIAHHVAEMRESLKEGSEARSIGAQLGEIFGARMRLTFIIALTLAIAQQSTGINAILFYAQTVLKQLGGGKDAAFLEAIWVGLTSVVFTVLGLLLVDRLGRRPLIIWGMAWIVASLGLCAYVFKGARYEFSTEAVAAMTEVEDAEQLNALTGKEFNSDLAFKQAVEGALGKTEAERHQGLLLEKAVTMNSALALFGILSFIAAFHFSVGPVMWVLFSEIFPISVRGIAIPFFTIITSVTSWIVQKIFPWQMEHMTMSSIFLSYAATVAVGLVILYFTLVETKNMSIEEIESALASK